MSLPNYDDWKLASPDDGCCEFCGIHERHCRDGWEPDRCTGECGRQWRDPDYERDLRLEDERMDRDNPRSGDDF